MASQTQVLITSDLSGRLWNICISDLFTGNTLMTFKDGGIHNHNCVDLISDQYVVAAKKDSPIINIWSLLRRDQASIKMICPGKVSALTVTPEGDFCIVAIGEKIYIWQFASGDLLAILEKHYQSVTCIRVSNDSSHFISGGEDGQALVWNLAQVLADNNNSLFNNNMTSQGWCSGSEPLHKWSHHTAKITDIHIGFGGIHSRCVTCSVDQTCKIYELFSGILIVTIVFDTRLLSVTMDPAEFFVFAGGEDGNIYEIRLFEKALNTLHKEIEPLFVGHSSAVTCLSVSIDGQALVSGSNDKNVKIWHINSHQCMKTIPHHGPISNVIVTTTPSVLLSNNSSTAKLLLPMKKFKCHLTNDSNENNSIYENGSIDVKLNRNLCKYLNDSNSINDVDVDDDEEKRLSNIMSIVGLPKEDENEENNADALKEKVKKLKKINEQIYNYAIDSIFKSTA